MRNNNKFSLRVVECNLELNSAMWDMLGGEMLYYDRKSMVPILQPFLELSTVPSGIVYDQDRPQLR